MCALDLLLAMMQTGTAILLTVTVTVVLVSTVALLYFKRKKTLELHFLSNVPKKGPVTLLDPDEKYALPLVFKEVLSYDTRKFRFELPSANHVLGILPGQCVYLSAMIDGKLVVRTYTPVSSDDVQGIVTLIIKVYFKDVNPAYPLGGKMTQHLNNMEIGETVDFRGPAGLIIYEGLGVFAVRPRKNASAKLNTYKRIGMIAGGSGITPMLQIINAVLKNIADRTKLRLIYANKNVSDILLRDELDSLADACPDRFSIWYTVERGTTDWSYSTGYVTADLIDNHLPCPSSDTGILLCGPPPMITLACLPALNKLGYDDQNIFTF